MAAVSRSTNEGRSTQIERQRIDAETLHMDLVHR